VTAPVQVGPSPSGDGPTAFNTSEYLADMGDRIRAERRSRGWTKTELARRSGLTDRTIDRNECGGSGLSLATLMKLCHAMDMSVGALLADDWQFPAPTARPRLTARQVQVLLAMEEGLSLRVAASRLGMTWQSVGARLSEAYQVLGVSGLPRDVRRGRAVRAARDQGLLPLRAVQ
jgi:DNA-binding Xre family transcriptional regulator